MNRYYTAYIFRGDDEIEVTAKLYDYGQVEEGFGCDVGYWVEVIEDPIFTDFVAFDDYGVELALTPREISDSEKQMVREYWDNWKPE